MEEDVVHIKKSAAPLLPFIQENLKALDVKMPRSREALLDLQLHLEQESLRIGLLRMVSQSEKLHEKTGVGMVGHDIRRLMDMWHQKLIPKIKQEMIACQERSESKLVPDL
jgi:hypothetical protein